MELGKQASARDAVRKGFDKAPRDVKGELLRNVRSKDLREGAAYGADLLQNPEEQERRTAVLSLGELQANEFVPHVLPLLKDPEGGVRDLAIPALIIMGGKK